MTFQYKPTNDLDPLPLILKAVRGATTLTQDTPAEYQQALLTLVTALLDANGIEAPHILSVFFTVTLDLTSENPARLCRKGLQGWDHVPMMCMQEPQVVGLPERCVRVLIQYLSPQERSTRPIPIYQNEAQKLRPDLM